MLILQVALPVPLPRLFDYLPPIGILPEQIQVGMRIRVPFGKTVDVPDELSLLAPDVQISKAKAKSYIGIIVKLTDHSDFLDKLKPALELLDSTPLLPPDLLQLFHWASDYYHYPLGEVIQTALPSLLNQGTNANLESNHLIKLSMTATTLDFDNTKMSENARTILKLLHDYPAGLNRNSLLHQLPNAATTLRSLEKKGWIIAEEKESYGVNQGLALNDAQKQAVDSILQHSRQFYPCLLDGVTGSGKTEVYLQVIEAILKQKKQALLLVPEINLTPQMIQRFEQRFHVPIVAFHSKLSDKERLQAWLGARDGESPIIIGTRSAVWTPLARPGVIIVDEEHDLSYKQQDRFRYSARDVAVVRAQRAKIPVILGSATPSLDSLFNAQQRRYHHLILPERAGAAVHPSFQIIDMRRQPDKNPLSQSLQTAIQRCLDHRQQVLLFINRRGYAPTLMCYECDWVATCQHCDAKLTFHGETQRLLCHHCGATRKIDPKCPKCGHPRLYLLGQGTERVEERLLESFPTARILRIDSDSTSSKRAMHTVLDKVHKGEVDILVGTQMLAKGHHFPKVTLVGVINIDGGLQGVDFRSSERVAQLVMQVAGRAGRADDPGKVLIQTFHPQHPLLLNLIGQGYQEFAQAALAEREEAEFPPFSRLALLRVEAMSREAALQFLEEAKQRAELLNREQKVSLWGPVAAPMERKANKYRAQLLLQSAQRDALHRLLAQWLPTFPMFNSKLHWSLDVDPQDLL